MAVLVGTPTNSEQGFLFSHHLTNIYCSLFYDGRLNGGKDLQVVLFSISLKANGVFKRFWNLLLASYIFHSFLLTNTVELCRYLSCHPSVDTCVVSALVTVLVFLYGFKETVAFHSLEYSLILRSHANSVFQCSGETSFSSSQCNKSSQSHPSVQRLTSLWPQQQWSFFFSSSFLFNAESNSGLF